MPMQTTYNSPEFQAIMTQVEAALAQAAEDARALAERADVTLLVRDVREKSERKANSGKA